MPSAISAVVRCGRIEVEAPPEWPDGTEVQIDLVCRSNPTADSAALTGAEFGVILDYIAKEKEEKPS